MTFFSKKFLWLWFLIFSAIFAAQIVPRIFQESPTNDEPIDLTTGYFYWQGDVLTHNHHPPLPKMLQALPLYFMGLKDSIPATIKDTQAKACYFFFILNNDHVEEMIHCGRFVSLLFGLAIGLVLLFCVRKKPFIVIFSTLLLWAFHPTLLTYSGLCLADLPVTLFFFLSVLLFQKHLENPRSLWAFLAGLMAGLSACAKFSSLALIPLFAILESADIADPSHPARPWMDRLKNWGFGAAGFLLSIGIIYLPGTLLLPGHYDPWFYFLAGLRNLASYSHYHHPTFFWGFASRQNHWLYFPATFLLKDTIPFLILLLTALGLALRKKINFPFWMWFSPLLFFVCILPVQNLGIRYLLPAFPFFILIVGETAGWLWEKRIPFLPNLNLKWLVGGFLIWNALSVLLNEPNMISYFNELVLPSHKAAYLADNDLDIGQDVKRLAEVAKQRGWKRVKLAQFGGVLNLSFYGVPVELWTQRDLLGPQPGFVYVMNISLFQIGPLFWDNLLPITNGWVRHTPPTGKVGDTWIYFEIPGEPQKDKSPKVQSIYNF